MELYTTEEVADMLKLDIQTIRRLIREEKLPAYKVGREYRIDDDGINHYIKKGVKKWHYKEP